MNLPTPATPGGYSVGPHTRRSGNDVPPDVYATPASRASPTRRANRRRLFVFLGSFMLAGAASLIYVYARPAEYRAAARVQINPGAVQVEAQRPTGGSQGADATRPLLTELQVLTSRPVLEATVQQLSATHGGKIAALGADPVATLQASLETIPAGGTDVVELAATGTDPDLAAAVVNATIGTYKERLEAAHRESAKDSLAQIGDEAAKLEARVLAQRRAVEDFRVRHHVVSPEREENELLARVRGQNTALNNANERLAIAEGRLRSLTDGGGKTAVRARDNPTLANLEQRVSQLREELRELERSYTPDYLALEPKVRMQRARLAELEAQIASQREVGQEQALADAQADVASAKEAVNRIQQQMAGDRHAVQAFTARFGEYKTLREDLAQLESMYRDTMQRKVKLEAGERARRPSVKVLEAAAVPQQAWRPDYLRDAAIGVGGSLLLALLVMGLVEMFNRPDPQPTVLVTQPVAYSIRGPHFPERASLPGFAAPAPETDPSALLSAAPLRPRELTPDELDALLAAPAAEVRIAVALLLNGLRPEEVVAVQWDDVDPATRQVRVAGASPRTLDVVEPGAGLLARTPPRPGTPLLAVPGGAALSIEALASELLYAAHDAGIDRPGEVTPEALWHTGAAFLARQGVRLADLAKVVGRLSAEQAAAYGALAPPGRRVALDEVDRVIPGVRVSDVA